MMDANDYKRILTEFFKSGTPIRKIGVLRTIAPGLSLKGAKDIVEFLSAVYGYALEP